jgi:hypothetical protein
MLKRHSKILICVMAGLLICGYRIPVFAKTANASVTFKITGDQEMLKGTAPEIEIYIETKGKFFDDISLDDASQYKYDEALPPGTYTAYPRVRFDEDEAYTLTPDKTEFTVQPNEKQTVKFDITYQQTLYEDDTGSQNMAAAQSESAESVSTTEADISNMETLSQEDLDKLISKVNDPNHYEPNPNDYELKNNYMAQHGLSDPALEARLKDYNQVRDDGDGTGYIDVSLPDYTGPAVIVTYFHGNNQYDILLSQSNQYHFKLQVPVGTFTFQEARVSDNSKRFNADQKEFKVENDSTITVKITDDYIDPDSKWINGDPTKKHLKIDIVFILEIAGGILAVIGLIVMIIKKWYHITHRDASDFM